MSKLRDIMNGQLNLVLEELETLEHSAERTKLRIMLIQALANSVSINFNDTPKSKDAIRDDYVKENAIDIEDTITIEDEGQTEEIQETTQEESVVQEEEEAVEENTEEIPMAIEPLIVLNEEDQEVDITDAYNSILYAADEDERQSLALQVTEYMCLPAYQTLNELVVTNAEGEQELLADNYYKFMLAYYLTPNEDGSTGLDVLDEYVSQFTDEQCNSLYEFINNDNIEAFITWLSN